MRRRSRPRATVGTICTTTRAQAVPVGTDRATGTHGTCPRTRPALLLVRRPTCTRVRSRVRRPVRVLRPAPPAVDHRNRARSMAVDRLLTVVVPQPQLLQRPPPLATTTIRTIRTRTTTGHARCTVLVVMPPRSHRTRPFKEQEMPEEQAASKVVW
uniref:Putative secreted protein n=1 Tax=Anopheles triannulatus TaxID=58253 RepID=A0A2M4B0T4_9DIPT